MGFLKDFWNGKLIEKDVDLEPTQAIFTLLDDSTRTVSRKGSVLYMGNFGPVVYKGKEQLHEYISDSKRQILKADDGRYFPVSQVKNIEIKVAEKIEKISWRSHYV